MLQRLLQKLRTANRPNSSRRQTAGRLGHAVSAVESPNQEVATGTFSNVKIEDVIADVRIKSAASDVTYQDLPVTAYSGTGQNPVGKQTANSSNSGQTVSISGNGWRKIQLPDNGTFNITTNTVLVFDYKASIAGEIMGIGFDNDEDPNTNSTQFYRLGGTQTLGNNWFTTATDFTQVIIPIGEKFTGSFKSLVLVCDHDVDNPTAAVSFQNLMLVEKKAGSPPTVPAIGNQTMVSNKIVEFSLPPITDDQTAQSQLSFQFTTKDEATPNAPPKVLQSNDFTVIAEPNRTRLIVEHNSGFVGTSLVTLAVFDADFNKTERSFKITVTPTPVVPRPDEYVVNLTNPVAITIPMAQGVLHNDGKMDSDTHWQESSESLVNRGYRVVFPDGGANGLTSPQRGTVVPDGQTGAFAYTPNVMNWMGSLDSSCDFFEYEVFRGTQSLGKTVVTIGATVTGYNYYSDRGLGGNPAQNGPGSSPGGFMLAGGGDEFTGQVDDGLKWFLTQAGGGDVVILGAHVDGHSESLPAIFRKKANDWGIPIDSFEAFVFHHETANEPIDIIRAAASSPFVGSQLTQAEAVWICGGDQLRYLATWSDTDVQSILTMHAVSSTAVIAGTSAGTSAGTHVQGNYVYRGGGSGDGLLSSLPSYGTQNQERTLSTTPFISTLLLNGVTTDTHFAERNRLGRVVAILAAKTPNPTMSLVTTAIGVDEPAALCISSSGIAAVAGTGAVYVVSNGIDPNIGTNNELLSSVVKVRGIKGRAFNNLQWFSLTDAIANPANVLPGAFYTVSISQSLMPSIYYYVSTAPGGSIYYAL